MNDNCNSAICWDLSASRIEALPVERRDKVASLRQRIRDGLYDADEFFDEAVDRLLERILGEDL